MQRVLPAMALSEEVISLCRQWLCEQDPERLQELTMQINGLLDPDASQLEESKWKAAVGAA